MMLCSLFTLLLLEDEGAWISEKLGRLGSFYSCFANSGNTGASKKFFWRGFKQDSMRLTSFINGKFNFGYS